MSAHRPHVLVRSYMTPAPHTIGPRQTLVDAHALMREHRIRHLPAPSCGVSMTTTVEPTPAVRDQISWYSLTADEVCRELDVNPDVGLTTTEVVERRKKYGANKLAEPPKEPRWQAFVRQYKDLMQLVLLGTAIVSWVALQDVTTALVVIGLTVLNALMGLNQEGKAAASVDSLKQMLIMTASVKRDGQIVELPSEELVPGDIVGFEAGDKVPADGRILVAATLEIEESGLTGESTPSSKAIDAIAGEDVALGDRHDMAFMNSQVTRGRGEMVVTSTGMSTGLSSAATSRDRTRGASGAATWLAASTPSTMSVTTSAKGRPRSRTDTTAPAG